MMCPGLGCITLFSPCRRGCSVDKRITIQRFAVFPVQAGMFRQEFRSDELVVGFPRAGGDVPYPKLERGFTPSFSPCRRGCSGE